MSKQGNHAELAASGTSVFELASKNNADRIRMLDEAWRGDTGKIKLNPDGTLAGLGGAAIRIGGDKYKAK